MTTTSTTVASASTVPAQTVGQGTPISPATVGDGNNATPVPAPAPVGADPEAKKARQAKALNLDEDTVKALNEVEGQLQIIRSKTTPKPARDKAISALTKAVLSLGLGARSGGFGPLVRGALSLVMADIAGEKTMKRATISVGLVVKACARKSIQKDGIAALKLIAQKLAEGDVKTEARTGKPVSADTLKARKANLALARAWFDHAGPKFYAMGWNGLKALGVNEIRYSGGSFKLDRAAALALGRAVTAAEVAGDEHLTVA